MILAWGGSKIFLSPLKEEPLVLEELSCNRLYRRVIPIKNIKNNSDVTVPWSLSSKNRLNKHLHSNLHLKKLPEWKVARVVNYYKRWCEFRSGVIESFKRYKNI